MTVTLAESCDTAAARSVPTDEPGAQRFDEAARAGQQTGSHRFYRFPGGCVTYEFSQAALKDSQIVALAGAALAFVPRERVATYVRDETGLSLCGAGVSCPGG